MPYDLNLTQRVRVILEKSPGVAEKKMFGGVGFLLRGNLVCGVQGDMLIVRVGKDNDTAARAQPHVHPFMGAGRKPMEGWITVAPEGVASHENLRWWIDLAYEFVRNLPEK